MPATLFDLLGRRIRELHLSGNGTLLRGEMALGTLTPGMYMLMVRTADGVRTGKVVVAR
ncbi:T9SS type A sorting domain-containing protein [bacterium]|nr:T9SS type A sorting domain-containing protein [bacterium]